LFVAMALAAGCAGAPGSAGGLAMSGASEVPVSGPALPGPQGDPAAVAAVAGDDFIVVAVADAPQVRPPPGSAARANYGRQPGYAGSDRALAQAADLAAEHGLRELKAWTIAALNWRCMLYRLPMDAAGANPQAAREAMLARLAADPRVRLAQPLNSFETLSEAPGYNDPYLPLQQGFSAIDAAGAQRVTRGEGITVAVIDTGIDSRHPDLAGRVAESRDFVGRTSAGERHGTEVAGVIAASANNGLGIVGVAPAARLLAYRSCWAVAPGAPARCNSFTLAQGLAAAISAGASVINLSLGGPRDPLLERLASEAMARGIVIVGALPAGGRRSGFPTALPGVLAVMASEDGVAAAGLLAAPGQRILTLVPGGGYDYASGSSLASAHVSGAVALLRAVDGTLDAAALTRLLGAGPAAAALGTGTGTGTGVGMGVAGAASINACRALQRLDPRVPPACAAAR
jgi:subtilisin family serine protease